VINIKKIIPYLIVVGPLVLVLTASFFITTFYLEKVTAYFNSAKELSLKEHLDSKKAKSEMWTSQLNLLFDYRYNRIEEGLEQELESRIDIAYKTARFIYEKYKKTKSRKDIKARIVDALGHMRYGDYGNYIFITDYSGNSILMGNQNMDKKNLVSYLDADYRSIVLEEIQKVRKRKEGFLTSNNSIDNKKEVILVKDLGAYKWFIGSIMKVEDREVALKESLIDMVKSIPLDNSDFIALYYNKKAVYLSSKIENIFKDHNSDLVQNSLSETVAWHRDEIETSYYHDICYEPLNLNFIYGFDMSSMSMKELQKQKDLELLLEKEFDFIVKSSGAIVLLVAILSLLLSRKVNQIFQQYQEEVESRRADLEELNSSLEERVKSEINVHRQKDKMLIQQSKMAEMGDMLSMIAHQWRQPLNQISYIFMNIESSYEYKELTKEYLEEKLKEGNEQLEFMSATIDDFRNYFRPDKDKEFALVSDIVQSSISLMKQTLDASSIEVELISDGRDLTYIYKNEFTQVLLNIIKNAKDALLAKKIQNPKIVIVTSCHKEKLVVEIFDNAEGIELLIIDKIFEPYFSTKDYKHGTGLGLYMSKMIIEEHLDGELSVRNTKDGACFRIEI